MAEPVGRPGRVAESGLLLRIALPLIAAYLAEIAMMITTKAVVGRLGYVELAAVGLMGDLAFEVLIVLMGGLSVVGVLVAQAEGRGRPADAGNAVRQGLVVATLVGVPATACVWYLPAVLVWTGQDPAVVALAIPYARAFSAFVLPFLWFSVLRTFVAALARTGAVMVITITAVGLNYALTRGLVEGAFGLPNMGVAGAAWASVIVAWSMLTALLATIYFSPDLRGYGLFRGRLRLDPAVGREIAQLGLPVAGLVLLESGLFVAVSVLSGVLGAVPLAAFEVLMSWVAIPFVIALGLAEATMVRVAYGLGRGSVAWARQSGLLGIAMGIAVLAVLLVVPLGLPHLITAVFLDPDDPGYGLVSVLVERLLLIVAIFQIFDGLQAVAARALRGFRDTVFPLWIAAVGYWGLGVGGGSLLAFEAGWGAEGLWWGLAGGLIVAACLLTWRFLWISRDQRTLPVRG